MKRFDKKGFTLIELMIVLAIIAILAVVLIPKAGQMKDNSRNAGVTTNVNAVRGILEAKVVDTNYLGDATNTRTLLSNTFTGDNAIVNPFKATSSSVAAGITTNETTAAADNSSIVVYNATGNVPTPIPTFAPIAANNGIIYVYVYSDGYIVFGVDSTISAVNEAIIK